MPMARSMARAGARSNPSVTSRLRGFMSLLMPGVYGSARKAEGQDARRTAHGANGGGEGAPRDGAQRERGGGTEPKAARGKASGHASEEQWMATSEPM